MSALQDEPTSSDAVAAWVASRMRAHNQFRHVYDLSERHRIEHGGDCTVYPSSVGPLLAVLAGTSRAERALEVGCGLGYGALCLASGIGADARVETIEQDPAHATLAREQFEREGFREIIRVLEGRGADVLPQLIGEYGFIFSDGDPDEYLFDLDQFIRLLAPGATLVTSNLFLGQYAPDMPGLDQTAAYRERLLKDARLRTAFLPSGLAISVRVA